MAGHTSTHQQSLKAICAAEVEIDMTSSNKNNQPDRTQFEEQEVLNAPLAIELQTTAKLMIEIIKKMPPQMKPAGIIIMIGIIHSMEADSDAIVNKFPSLPHIFSRKFITEQFQLMRKYFLKNL